MHNQLLIQMFILPLHIVKRKEKKKKSLRSRYKITIKLENSILDENTIDKSNHYTFTTSSKGEGKYNLEKLHSTIKKNIIERMSQSHMHNHFVLLSKNMTKYYNIKKILYKKNVLTNNLNFSKKKKKLPPLVKELNNLQRI